MGQSGRSLSSKGRKKFLRKKPPPWTCFFCGKNIKPRDMQVHHIDHNHNNNKMKNLAPAHSGCHRSYHFKLRNAEYMRRNTKPPRVQHFWPLD